MLPRDRDLSSFMHERLWEGLLDMLGMVGATPLFARCGEVSGREALHGSIGGFSITLESKVGGSAMAGAVGGRGDSATWRSATATRA